MPCSSAAVATVPVFVDTIIVYFLSQLLWCMFALSAADAHSVHPLLLDSTFFAAEDKVVVA
jgi:hypothetical protein